MMRQSEELDRVARDEERRGNLDAAAHYRRLAEDERVAEMIADYEDPLEGAEKW